MKRTLLIVIDALASRVVFPAMEQGKLPNLNMLCQRGEYDQNCTAIFPSITPAALASIVTGRYPVHHGIPGAYYFDTTDDTVRYFGGDYQVVLQRGLKTFFHNFLIKLNNEILRADTLFRTVERHGMKSACLNYFIFDGEVEHEVNIPLLMKLLPGIPFSEKVHGPTIFYLGDFVQSKVRTTRPPMDAGGGVFNRFGFQDDSTFDLLMQMAEEKTFPEFTLAYFPDNDWDSHEMGPDAALETLEHFDERLGAVIEQYGGVERLLNDLCVIVTGDHSQSDIIDKDSRDGVDLSAVLSGWSMVGAGEKWTEHDQLMICPNLRAAQIYVHNPEGVKINRIIERLFVEDRIDQVFWKDIGRRGYRIDTADRGRLRFWKGDDGANTAKDVYGYAWSWEGDLRTVDGTVHDDGTITFGDYPNAFERITAALDAPHSAQLWVTAKPGYDLVLPAVEEHTGGGSHGSLHALDSLVPLIMAGAPEGVHLPPHPRSVDVEPLVLQSLGIEPQIEPGASHVTNPPIREP